MKGVAGTGPKTTSLCVGLCALMLGAAFLSHAAMPKPIIASEAQIPSLDSLIPDRIGQWQIDRSIIPLEVSPDVAKTLSTIYDRTLSRTYVNESGQRVMLSLAYGANQSRALQLHKPEVCYAAQGFKIRSVEKTEIEVAGASVPVMRMVAQQGARVEPITYWMRIGDAVSRGWYEQNLARFEYGLRGYIPDGLLFRISSISADSVAAYELQQQFISELMPLLSGQGRHMLLGSVANQRLAS